MKFRRKSSETAQEPSEESTPEPVEGPYDADALPPEDHERVDLGSLLIAPSEGRELRLQVDEASGTVQAVMIAGPDGMLELRAFAAPRNGDLWEEVRHQIAGELGQKGGTATERMGRFGTELVCQVQVQTQDGAVGTQASRVIGVNGPRWMLRATLLGRPATDPDGAGTWEDAIADVAVRRGEGAMMVGEALPVTVPSGARRLS